MTSPADQFNQRTIAEFRASHGRVGGNFAGAPPSSSARRRAAADSSSSASPQPSGLPSIVTGPPMAQHPNPIALTSMPLRPRTLFIPVPFDIGR